MSTQRTTEDEQQPITQQRLVADLQSGGLGKGAILLVHTSLSSLGWVCGGALAVVRALLQVAGREGTVVMPTHSAVLSEPSNWGHPPVPSAWWPVIRESMPAYEPTLTPTWKMGAVPELFRAYPGVVRSQHPAASFAAAGRMAESVVASHHLEDSFGEGSPLRKLYDWEASVLLLGVGFGCCTMLHLAERRALGRRQQVIAAGAPLLVEGERKWVAYQEPEVSSDDFPELGADLERDTQIVRTFPVGYARAKLVPVRPLVDYGVQWIRAHRV